MNHTKKRRENVRYEKNIEVEGFELYFVIKRVVFLQAYIYLNVDVVVPFHSVILFIYMELKQYIFFKAKFTLCFCGCVDVFGIRKSIA